MVSSLLLASEPQMDSNLTDLTDLNGIYGTHYVSSIASTHHSLQNISLYKYFRFAKYYTNRQN